MKIKFSLLLFFIIIISANAQRPKQTIQEVINIEQVTAIPPGMAINCVLVDENNTKWVGTDKGLYKVMGLDSGKSMNRTAGVTNMTRGGEGKDWAALRTGVVVSAKINDKVLLLEKSGDNPRINCIEKVQNQLWVGTDDGLYVLYPETDMMIEHYHSGNTKLLTNQINDVLYKNGVKWVATDKGLYRVVGNNWKNYERNTSFTVLDESKAGVWALSKETLWSIDKNNRWYPVDLDGRMRTGTVQDIATDTEGNIYFVSEALVKYNPYKNKSKKIDEKYGFASKTSTCIEADEAGFLWVGTRTDGLFRVEFTEEAVGELTALCFVDTEIPCGGQASGAIRVNVTGGVPPYRFAWNRPGFEEATLTDLAAGTYSVTVTDEEGSIQIANVILKEPSGMVVTVEEAVRISEKNRKDGKATVSVSGGTSPYTYLWPNESTTPSVKRLATGKHIVTVTDAAACRAMQEVLIDKEPLIPELKEVAMLEVGQTLQVNELYFKADSAIITDQSYSVLNEVYQFLRKNDNVFVEIGGHTNNIPPDDYCNKLSTERAQNVANHLYTKGISEEQLSYKGYGKTTPIASNKTIQGRRRNQRVEIKILDIVRGN